MYTYVKEESAALISESIHYEHSMIRGSKTTQFTESYQTDEGPKLIEDHSVLY
jgi:hypothetical protein